MPAFLQELEEGILKSIQELGDHADARQTVKPHCGTFEIMTCEGKSTPHSVSLPSLPFIGSGYALMRLCGITQMRLPAPADRTPVMRALRSRL